MAGVTRKVGAKVQLDGEKEYKDALANLNAANRALSTEMQKLQAQYKGNTESTEYLKKAGELLEQRLLSQQEKVAAVRARYEEAVRTLGESNKKTMDLKAALNQAETAEINLQHAIDENNAALNGQNSEMAGLGDTVSDLASKLGIRLPEGATKALNGMQGLSAGTVAAMAAATAAIAAVVKAVKEVGEITLQVAAEVDEYLAQSSITGVPAEMLQAWDYAAPLVDTDAETIKGAMTKITRAMGDAADGSEKSQQAFASLGVSIEGADGQLRSAEEVFYDVIDALGQVSNQTERDAIAMDLMGKSAQDLNPLIDQGSQALKDYAKQAEAAGYVLDESQLQKLGEVDDAYQELQLTIEANRRQLAADFAPAAKEAMELFSDVVRKAGEMLKQSGLIENLSLIIQNLISIIRSAGEMLTKIPAFNKGLELIKETLGAIAMFTASIADAAELLSAIMDPSSWGSGRITNALGFGYSSGNANNFQRTRMQLEGTYDQYMDFYGDQLSAAYGADSIVNSSINNDVFRLNPDDWLPQPHNAGGTDYWRGGLTWVGESGPELVSLPRGSAVYDAQESAEFAGGDVFNFYVDISQLQDLQALIELARSARVRSRMR